MRKTIWIVVITVFIILAGIQSYSANAEFFGDKREMLRDIQGFRIFIAPLSSDLKALELTEDLLKNDIEFQFKTEGIPFSESSDTCLYININTVYLKDLKQFIYNMEMKLLDMVVVVRKPEVSCYASIWSDNKLGIINQDLLKTTIRASLKEKIDTFIEDYSAVNPKNSN
jgi:hypothetical protein